MSEQYPGGFISKTEPTVNGSIARGLWTLSQAAGYAKQGLWPTSPGAPTIGTATAGDTTASVAFTAPANTGSTAITAYTATSSPGGLTGTGASSPITVSGLTNGTAYTFTVTATNSAGTGPSSAASNSVSPVQNNYVEEVFSTWLYTGNGSTQTITNGIDLAGKGGLVWSKARSTTGSNTLCDTVQGRQWYLYSNYSYSRTGPSPSGSDLTSFNSNGFSLGANNQVDINTNSTTYASWTFREQPKFFDVVTYTGDGTNNRTINHSLNSEPGCVIVKNLSQAGNWWVYHRSLGLADQLILDSTVSKQVGYYEFGTNAFTSTTFGVSNDGGVNRSGDQYVAYLFAHNAGGFGLTGTDNVISCGSFTTDGSGNATVNLGYEPQWILWKSSSNADNWRIGDNMRGWTTSEFRPLFPNLSNAEGSSSNPLITSTGFQMVGDNASRTFIYIAIRRGPMRVPTDGTKVLGLSARTGTGANATVTGSAGVTDLAIIKNRGSTPVWAWVSRLTNKSYLSSNALTAETAAGTTILQANPWDVMDGIKVGTTSTITNANSNTFINYLIDRAPNFMDVVCYTGTGSVRTVAHNLAAVPELMFVKKRADVSRWLVYPSDNTDYLQLNDTAAVVDDISMWNDTSPTSSVFTVGSNDDVNGVSAPMIAYLFATCPGVSKVGSYTGTGTTQTINCGFTGGARFVMIKRTDSTGDWYVWDTARGIVAGNDPYLLLNSTAAEVTNTDYVDTASTGFEISSTAPAAINASGGTFIFLAIA